MRKNMQKAINKVKWRMFFINWNPFTHWKRNTPRYTKEIYLRVKAIYNEDWENRINHVEWDMCAHNFDQMRAIVHAITHGAENFLYEMKEEKRIDAFLEKKKWVVDYLSKNGVEDEDYKIVNNLIDAFMEATNPDEEQLIKAEIQGIIEHPAQNNLKNIIEKINRKTIKENSKKE